MRPSLTHPVDNTPSTKSSDATESLVGYSIKSLHMFGFQPKEIQEESQRARISGRKRSEEAQPGVDIRAGAVARDQETTLQRRPTRVNGR